MLSYEEFLNEGRRPEPDKFRKQDILGLFGKPTDVDWEHDKARIKALLVLYDRQTEEEQYRRATTTFNKMGFTASDASILTSFAQQILNGKLLTENQMYLLRMKIEKYAKQIASVANEVKANGRDKFVDDQWLKWVEQNRHRYQRPRQSSLFNQQPGQQSAHQ